MEVCSIDSHSLQLDSRRVVMIDLPLVLRILLPPSSFPPLLPGTLLHGDRVRRCVPVSEQKHVRRISGDVFVRDGYLWARQFRIGRATEDVGRLHPGVEMFPRPDSSSTGRAKLTSSRALESQFNRAPPSPIRSTSPAPPPQGQENAALLARFVAEMGRPASQRTRVLPTGTPGLIPVTSLRTALLERIRTSGIGYMANSSADTRVHPFNVKVFEVPGMQGGPNELLYEAITDIRANDEILVSYNWAGVKHV
jgi:hypothetical protein